MPETPGKQFALATVFSLLPVVPVVMRLCARRKTKAGLWVDDWSIVFALLATIATGVLMIVGAAVGNSGGHAEIGPKGVINNNRQQVFRLTTYANTIVQLLALGPTKLSVLLFYRRIFRGKWFNIASWVLIGAVSAWTIAFFFSNLFICVPINSRVSTQVLAITGSKCVRTTKMFLAQSYADFSLDILILALPIPMIWNLHMARSRKVQVSLIFLLGAITTAASITRTWVQYDVGKEFDRKNPDTPSYLPPIVYWPLIEASLGVVAACLPTLRPIVQHWSMEELVGSIRSTFSRERLTLKSSQNSIEKTSKISEDSSQPSNIGYREQAYYNDDVFQNKDYVQKTAIEGTRSGVPEGDSIAPQTGILVEKIFRAESA
ncbi:hypothetical protein MMC14_008292 [Varicellaria rhodocarpa]|nr:hypothetical protein [Varicellaria rhodocarpa]